MKNNAISTLKYDIAAGATALVATPLSGTPFGLPDPGTDSTGVTTGAVKTYGRPIEVVMLVDRLDVSQAKMEIIWLTTAAAEAGGAYTHQVAQRGAEGTTALAWTAGAFIIQVPTAQLLNQELLTAILRSQFTAVHKRDGVMFWDGANFKWDTFRFGNTGRGKHFSSDGYITVAMPANAKVVVGYGGAANINVAAGAIALPESTALYFEPNISGANTDADVGDRFRAVALTGDFVVPRHWLLIAAHVVVTAGDKVLRVCNGASLVADIDVAAGVGFTNAWVNFGAAQKARYQKGADQLVRLRGRIKTGAIGSVAFTLPAGFRPEETRLFAVPSNGAHGEVQIDTGGGVTPTVGSNTSVFLDGITFLAVA